MTQASKHVLNHFNYLNSSCCSIASLVRILLELNLKETSKQWMEYPSASNLLIVSDISHSILQHQQYPFFSHVQAHRKDSTINLHDCVPLVHSSEKHKTFSELPVILDEMELFEIIKCTSETEVVSKNVLITRLVNWCSSEFSKLSRQLDQIHIIKMINLQGPQHVQAFNLERIWKPDDTPSVWREKLSQWVTKCPSPMCFKYPLFSLRKSV
ncbi:hypothetical protein VP01_2849g1 [Puccinia sorghi]|uniref:Uncharacterized protein n=1 Tax=Puccinia sorghi TaxID=27349 RepID=A0A0L6V2U3_9BASI|nr:hypothetical protein VP01_2849g1 [Puccinia sorghi]